MTYIGPLNDAHLPGFVDLAINYSSEEDRAARIASYREKLAVSDASVKNIVVIADESDKVIAAMRLLPLGESTFTLSGLLVAEGAAVAESEYGAMLEKLIDRARDCHAREVSTRMTAEQSTKELVTALEKNDFRRILDRIEFRAMLDDLPSEEGSPLIWRSMATLGLPFAAEMLLRCSVGDPYSQEEEDPVAAINEMLTDKVLTSSPDCVQVGYLENEPVAFACAQVNPSSGWSTIRYMGLVPEVRGRGLGRWVHRHGFAMLREQGGKLYHGGTAASNAPMLALFAAHGCAEFVRGTEWAWRGEAGA